MSTRSGIYSRLCQQDKVYFPDYVIKIRYKFPDYVNKNRYIFDTMPRRIGIFYSQCQQDYV